MYFINGQSKWRSDSTISSWYEVWEYGIKSHFLRWGRPSGNQVIIISDNNRNRDWGILFNQNPRRNRQGRNPESDNKFFYPILSEFLFHGGHFLFLWYVYLLVFTSSSLCWSIHLNRFSFRQSLCIKEATTAGSCDQLFNGITMGSYDQSFMMPLNQKRSHWINQPFWVLIWSWFINLYLFAHVISLTERIHVRHMINSSLIEVGPLCTGFPVLKIDCRYHGFDTQERVVRQITILG